MPAFSFLVSHPQFFNLLKGVGEEKERDYALQQRALPSSMTAGSSGTFLLRHGAFQHKKGWKAKKRTLHIFIYERICFCKGTHVKERAYREKSANLKERVSPAIGNRHSIGSSPIYAIAYAQSPSQAD